MTARYKMMSVFYQMKIEGILPIYGFRAEDKHYLVARNELLARSEEFDEMTL